MKKLLLRLFVKNYTDTRNPAVRTQYGKLAGITGIFCNLLLFAGKLVVGTLCKSVSITADAVNNLSDASSSVVTLLGFKFAGKPADPEHPYGHNRMEYLSGLCVAAMILLIGAELVKTSVARIVSPEPVEFSLAIVLVLVGSILLKLWMAGFNRSLGMAIDSAALAAAAADSRNDVIATGAVLVSCVVGKLTGARIDGWTGLCVALFILWSGIGIAKDTIDPLLGIYVAHMGPICANGLLHAADDVAGPAALRLGDGVRGRHVLVTGAGVIGLLLAWATERPEIATEA